jgi:hypothetical protein
MTHGTSKRRLAENQAIFRESNERIQSGFDAINKTARQEGERPHTFDEDTVLHFYCECSDEKCQRRIQLSLKDYNRIHAQRDTFTVVCGHAVPEVERVVDTLPDYCIIEKYEHPPKPGGELNPTNLHHN